MLADRSWMYRRLDPSGDIRDEFTEGVKEFLDFALRHPTFISGDKIKCPCRKCDNMQYHVRDDVAVHLYAKGFTHYYNIWYAHGEILYKEPAGVKPSKTKNGTGICGHPQTKSRKSDGGRQKGLQKRLNMFKKSNERKHSHVSGNCPDVVMCPVDNEVLNEVDRTHRLRSWGARKGRRSSLTTPFGTEASRMVGDTVDTGQDDWDEGSYNVARAEDSDYGSRAPIDPTKGQPLEIISGSFIDPKVPRTIVSTIKSYFSQPWPTWKKVPREVKDFLWKKFEEKYTWHQDQTLLLKDVWEKTCARRFRGILTQARDDAMHRANKTNVVETKGFGPAWMKPSIWNSLINIYWSDEKWQKKSKTGQKNRLSEKDGGITKHSGGSIPFAAHKKKMVLELGRPVTQLELFDRTHKRKGGKGDFIDNKSKRVRFVMIVLQERYAEALTSKYGSDSSQLDFDPDAWLDATGGPIKGQLYGFGGREDAQRVVGAPCTSSASFSKHHGSSNNSQLLTKEEVVKLMQDKMQEMQEELSRREEEMRAQINKEVETRMHAMLSQLRIPVNRPPPHESSNNSNPSKDSDSNSYRWRVHSYESIGDKMEIGNKRDEEDHPNLDALLSAFEILSIIPSAIISIGCAVNYTFMGPNKSFQPSFLNKFFVWQCVFLVGAVAISCFIRQRLWRRISKVSYKTGSKSFNLVDRIEKLEEDIKSSARIIRVLTRQVEKLGIRFRVTRKTLKGSITETAALAQKNSEATRALALQEDNLEKELGEIQKALLAMQDQQRKQLELIVAIGKFGLLRESRQNHVPGDNGNLSHSSSSETREAENREGEGGQKDLKAV